ncbi:hypothetical protein QL996_12735 [Planococcus sp. APC 4015]|nr:hypothetical protein [Planococcus sp. APC 4015]
MSPGTRRGLALLVTGAVVLVGFQLAERAQVVSELAAADQVGAVRQAAVDAETTDARDLGEQHAELLTVSTTYDALLDARDVFVASLGTVDAAFGSASGKVDTAARRAEVLELQQEVLTERTDPTIVTDAAATADGVAQAVTASVADFDREQARIAAERAAAAAAASRPPRVWSGSSAAAGPVSGGYDRVRAALDRVGGGHVRLEEFAGACGGGTAAACASPGVIRFTPGLASWSDARLHWAMTHELAHTYQFPIWGALVSSNGYSSLFGGNIELLANCMAAQRGYGSANVSCSGAQLQWAGAIWTGGVPG